MDDIVYRTCAAITIVFLFSVFFIVGHVEMGHAVDKAIKKLNQAHKIINLKFSKYFFIYYQRKQGAISSVALRLSIMMYVGTLSCMTAAVLFVFVDHRIMLWILLFVAGVGIVEVLFNRFYTHSKYKINELQILEETELRRKMAERKAEKFLLDYEDEEHKGASDRAKTELKQK